MSRKPETYLNVLYNGTGFYDPSNIRRLKLQQGIIGAIIPAFRRNEKAYFESVRESSITEIHENAGRIVKRLGLAAGQTAKVDIPPRETEYPEDYKSSDVSVYITGTEKLDEAGETQKGAQYAIYVSNPNLDTEHLFFAETEHEPEPSDFYFNATQRFVGAFAVDVANGRHYSVDDYLSSDGARLLETIGHTLNCVDFQMMISSQRKSPLPTERI